MADVLIERSQRNLGGGLLVVVTSIRTPARAPRANSIIERVIRTARQECLDHVILPNERHLERLLKEFLNYYNDDQPTLGGLHHVHARAA